MFGKTQSLVLTIVALACCGALHAQYEKRWESIACHSWRVSSADDFSAVPDDADSLVIEGRDDAVYDLSRFKNLQQLIVQSHLINPNGDSRLRNLPSTLVGFRIACGDIKFAALMTLLKNSPHLNVLEISCWGAFDVKSKLRLDYFGDLTTFTFITFGRADSEIRHSPWDSLIDLPAVDDWLRPLANLSKLTKVVLDMPRLPLPATLRIATLPTLKSFASTQVTDDALAGFVEMESPIEELNLAGNKLVTDYGMEFLPRLKNLRRLCVAGCINVGDFGIPHIAAIPHLEELDISAQVWEYEYPPTPTYPLNHLSTRGDDRNFRLQFPEYLSQLGDIKTLKVLTAHNVSTFTSKILSDVVMALPSLETLDISGCVGQIGKKIGNASNNGALSDASHLEFLHTHKSLKKIVLAATLGDIPRPSPLTSAALASLAESQTVEAIDISGAEGIAADSIAALSKAKQLRTLNMGRVVVKGDLGAALLSLTQLESVSVSEYKNNLDIPELLAARNYVSLELRVLTLRDDVLRALANSTIQHLSIVSYKPAEEAKFVELAESLKSLKVFQIRNGDSTERVSLRNKITAVRKELDLAIE